MNPGRHRILLVAGLFCLLPISSAAKAAEVVTALTGEEPAAAFAPTEEALEKLPEGALEAPPRDRERPEAALLHHMIDRVLLPRGDRPLKEGGRLSRDARRPS